MGEKIKQTSGLEGLEERVAFREMSRVVARWSTREKDVRRGVHPSTQKIFVTDFIFYRAWSSPLFSNCLWPGMRE